MLAVMLNIVFIEGYEKVWRDWSKETEMFVAAV